MKYLFILTWISCLLGYHSVYACRCATLPKLDSVAQLSNYNFIAHVVITDDGDQVAVTSNEAPGMLTFKIITLFKGKAVSQLLEYEKNSSCDMGITKGEEWILFGVLTDGKLSIRACDRNIRYSEVNGERDWVYKSGIEDLEKLQELYKKPPKVYPDGLFISRYKNGNKELEENYLDNKLHGTWKIWYANGQLQGSGNYINGLPDGKSEWFYPSGQIYQEMYFKEGKKYNVFRLYYDTAINPAFKKLLITDFYKTEDSLNKDFKKVQVHYENVFSAAGELLITRSYARNGLHRSVTLLHSPLSSGTFRTHLTHQ
jgi:hypothetical protein